MKQILLALFLIAVPAAAFTGFEVLVADAKTSGPPAGLGDLSSLETIIADVQADAAKGDLAAAAKRITDYESAWDQGQTAIRPLNPIYWGNIDDASDAAISALRASTPSPDRVKSTLAALMAELKDPSKPVE
jgi:hypothetical protein